MYNINCKNERQHKTNKGEHSLCDAFLCGLGTDTEGIVTSICRICSQKWEISIHSGAIELKKIPKDTRFTFDDVLKVEG
jgi:hypothetical protein